MFRNSEIVLLVYFLYTIAVAYLLPASSRGRRRVLATNVSILALYTAFGWTRLHLRWDSILRDWVALGLTHLCYKEMGWLAPARHTYRLEKSWIVWDRRFLNDWGVKAAIERCGSLIPAILEL